MQIVRCSTADQADWQALRALLWPDTPADEHAAEIAQQLAAPDVCAAWLAQHDGRALGLAEATLRHDYVNGTSTSPVLFLEGLFVLPAARRQGIARALVTAAAHWGHAHGCQELASDTPLDNVVSQAVHRALGFAETERVVFFRRELQ